MKSLYTKQPLNKGHLCITAKTVFPKGVRYRGVPLYNQTLVNSQSVYKKSKDHNLLFNIEAKTSNHTTEEKNESLHQKVHLGWCVKHYTTHRKLRIHMCITDSP